jgi:hypothetical protein
VEASVLNFPLGAAGVLHHKKFLNKDVGNKELFLNLAPYADDIWFYFMALLNNTSIRVVRSPYTNMRYVNPYREYNLQGGFKLSSINFDDDRNDVQFAAVSKYYNIDFPELLQK